MLVKSTAVALSRAFLLFLLIGYVNAEAQTPPPGFASVMVSNQWNEVVGLTFTHDGATMFVWERGGRVYTVTNGNRILILDISEEVGAWHDHGMLGFALDPHFDENGYIYLLYVVDRHHLMNYGTALYNPGANEYFAATIGRLTRFTAVPDLNGVYNVNPASRKILIGETKSTGIPIISITHGVGSLVFGTDHTLLVSTGDGASPSTYDYGSLAGSSYFAQALADNIISDKENVGAFRSQLVDCLNGKILRIDPETGNGIPSNPFYDPARPDRPSSKVWAQGLRNPFRMILKPGTGSHAPEDGNPGMIYLGDVGWVTFEELNKIDGPGQNLGWPIYEGLTALGYATLLTPNKDAPNPLYQIGGCSQQFFNFQDLIKQATPSGTSTFPNPCNGSQNIPSSIPTFVHTRPMIDWQHGAGPARTGIFSGQTAAVINIGASGSPVAGPQFGGNAAIAGAFYTGTDFPPEFQNTLFFGDYTGGWIKNLTLNENNQPVEVKNFVDNNAVVVCMATHPTSGGLYYANFPTEIRRIIYTSNQPPLAVATADKTFGASPLGIQFTGDQSSDPEDQQLTYEWNFGDGSPLSNTSNPSHTFIKGDGTPGMFTVTLKVTDPAGAEDVTSLVISINNTPPQVEITSPSDGTHYPLTGETLYQLRATVTDDEHTANQLTYRWQTTLHHESHIHPEPPDNLPETSTSTAPVGCDGETYFYSITLTVTDAAGASTTKEVRLYPDCSGIVKVDPLITWSNPAAITQGIALGFTQLNATASYNGQPVPGSFDYTPAIGTVLDLGLGQQLSVVFTPVNTVLYNTASKTVTIDVVELPPAAFYRALNLNGPALTIDGNSWQSSTGAADFSFTQTGGGVFSNQSIQLNPPTDANRATMIRSSIWGNSVSINVTSVPTNTYDVYLYVWEDNFTQTYSVSVEGIVVVPVYNSGGGGTWSKLGPFRTNITDGTINVSANGGHALLSGLEVWTAGPPPPNQPPVVANPIVDQNATPGIAFNYTFPANTFSDPNAGTSLTYTATLQGGAALPDWLTFTGSTRTFSGTPLPENLGTINIAVTASDGVSDVTATDVFALTVGEAPTTAFYRALNLNGSALTIDGNSWQSSIGAANFNYSQGGGGVFSNQSISLTPATDPNRATMIRSSIYGNTVSLNMTAVPSGSYLIWLYVWEDNSSQTYSISLEGSVVLSNFASGATGAWTKLGPYLVNITDSEINVSANGGQAMLSGIEVWTAGPPQPNQPPVVANPIVDQNASAGVPFTFAFPDNTFSDPNAGTTLTYTATLQGGAALPGWLTFTGSTRTFSGTPLLANLGSINIAVTASDGTPGGTVSDVFTITVGEAPTSGFYRALNLNGAALTIDGNSWQSSIGAANFSYTASGGVFSSQTIPLNPSTDANRTSMIRSSIWGNTVNVNMTAVPSGSYLVWLYVWEDNFSATYSISLEGSVVRSNFVSGAAGAWTKLGPYPVTITDGAINVSTNGGHSNVSGLEVWTAGPPPPNQPPVVANPIVDQNTTAGLPFSFAFPANTFSDPNGTTLTYTATLNGGGALPGWLTFTASTRTFSGTPLVADLGTINIAVTASDGAPGGTVTDVFALTVGEAVQVTPLITWSNPAPIGQGTALGSTQLNATASYNGSPVSGSFVYTPPSGTVLGLGTGQQLSVTFTPSNTILYTVASKTVTIDVVDTPSSTFYRALNLNGAALTIDGNSWQSSIGAANFSYTASGGVFSSQTIPLNPSTDANRTSMIRSSIWGNTVNVNMTAVPSGSYLVWLYVWEDNFSATYSISLEGSVVRSNFVSGAAGAWTKLGPYPVTITDGAINVSTNGGHSNVSGLEVWTAGPPPPNQPPVVANPIVDQNTTAGLPFSFAFPANTFSDPNGTTLTYTATLNGGGALPGWLTFTASTRTFSGTPLVADLGTINIAVTASDGAPGGTVTDVFALTVGEAVQVTPLITWSNPAPIGLGTPLGPTQLNATASYNGSPVSGSFDYTPASGIELGLGTHTLEVEFTPTNTVLYTTASKSVTIDVVEAPPSAFYRALNLNGAALTIDGNSWQSSIGAANFSFTQTSGGVFSSQTIPLNPSTDANRTSMIRSSIWGRTVNLNMTAVPSGSYQVWLYVWEDNFSTIYSVSLEGSVVLSNFASGGAGAWTKLGPYPVTITDGAINVSTNGGHANVSGLEVWTVSTGGGGTSARVSVATEDEGAMHDSATLEAYPNPFGQKLTVRYTARQSGHARLELFDVRGRSIHLIHDENMLAGETKEKELDTSTIPDGVYFLQFANGKYIFRLKLMGMR